MLALDIFKQLTQSIVHRDSVEMLADGSAASEVGLVKEGEYSEKDLVRKT